MAVVVAMIIIIVDVAVAVVAVLSCTFLDRDAAQIPRELARPVALREDKTVASLEPSSIDDQVATMACRWRETLLRAVQVSRHRRDPEADTEHARERRRT